LPGPTTKPSSPSSAKTAGGGLSYATGETVAFAFSGQQLAVAAGSAVLLDSTPRRKFKKDLIRVGEYHADGVDLQVTAIMLSRWADQFATMKANGVKVPIPVGHTSDAEAVRGYVDDIYVDGDTLYMIAEMIGEDGIALASRTEVSINTEPGYVDGKGNKYTDPITHVALTPVPVVPDQDGFIPIAASRDGKPTRARLFRLALSTEKNMEYLTKIAAMLGVEGIESLDEAGLADAIAKSIEAMQGMSKDAKEKGDEASAELSAVKASLSKKPDEPSPTLVRMAAENRSMKLSRLVASGNITPAVKDKLAGIWIGRDNAGLKLSLDDRGDGQFAALIDALESNDPVKLGEQTRAAGVTLSRANVTTTTDPISAARALMGTIGIGIGTK